eukprot:1564293-Lingulodinium_polyedra.AAC.1
MSNIRGNHRCHRWQQIRGNHRCHRWQQSRGNHRCHRWQLSLLKTLDGVDRLLWNRASPAQEAMRKRQRGRVSREGCAYREVEAAESVFDDLRRAPSPTNEL